MKPSKSVHALIVPYPAQGHINPMIQFAKRLISKDLRATLALTVATASSMHSVSQQSFPVETFSDGYDIGGWASAESTEAYLASLAAVGTETLASLIKRLEATTGSPVDVVVYDGFLPWVLDVAKRLGKLTAVFFTQSCAISNVYYHVQRGLLPLPLTTDAVVELPGMPPLRPEEMPSYVSNYGSYPAFAELIVHQQYSNIDGADFMLFSSFYELELQAVDWIKANLRPSSWTVGPMVPPLYLNGRLRHDTDYGTDLFKPDSAACMSWLDRKELSSVVYVSFGSMAQLGVDQMAELAWALKNSGYHFLWIVRATEMPKLPAGFMPETEDQGLIVSWCPQLQVLSHEAIGCFLTHCGWNSTQEAICFGVPIVAMPQWTDQITNAKYVEDIWKIGIRAKPEPGQKGDGVISRDAIEMCIRDVMMEDGKRAKEIKRNCSRLRDAAKVAIGEGGSSDKNIDEFVARVSSASPV